MSMIDEKISNCDKENIVFFKRFIDDILIIWTGTEEMFVNFMKKINNLHETIKFTHSYDLKDNSTTTKFAFVLRIIPYLLGHSANISMHS